MVLTKIAINSHIKLLFRVLFLLIYSHSVIFAVLLSTMEIIEAIHKTLNLVSSIDSSNHFNERYIHHCFSRIIQEDTPVSFNTDTGLHPEWATFIKNVRPFGRYKRNGYCYYPALNDGAAGYIDFAIGKSENPDYAIEFKMANKLDVEGLIFDYMKLMDQRNPIMTSISVAIYYGHTSHSRQCERTVLNNCILEAKNRLRELFVNRPHYFYLMEIVKAQRNRLFTSIDDLEFKELTL